MIHRLFIATILSILLLGCHNSGLQRGFARTGEAWELELPSAILFTSDAASVKPQSRAQLEQIANLLQGMKIVSLRIDGHTDATGSDAYNERLSLRRAQAVADILVEAGLPKDLLQVRGLGKRLPVLDNKTAQGRAQNRRVAIVVLTP